MSYVRRKICPLVLRLSRSQIVIILKIVVFRLLLCDFLLALLWGDAIGHS